MSEVALSHESTKPAKQQGHQLQLLSSSFETVTQAGEEMTLYMTQECKWIWAVFGPAMFLNLKPDMLSEREHVLG
jgi:hypothetical protein